MDMKFLPFISGWDGCAADSTMYSRARVKNFPIPEDRQYLADPGFDICDSPLVPYRNIRYHLAKWGRANQRPANPKELYNLRHSAACNIVERTFGVMKKGWVILTRPPHFTMGI